MRSILKKNQIVAFVIGLMVITAGYLSYSNNENDNSIEASAIADSEEMASIGDAKLVSANIAQENNLENSNILNEINITANDKSSLDDTSKVNSNTISNDNNNTENVTNVVNSTTSKNSVDDIETSANTIDEYFTNSRLERNTMYSQRIENYQDILNNTNVTETQKKTAQEEIIKLNNEQNAIMIAENIIKTKGIEDLVIFKNGDSINVIVKGKDLEKEEIAQIQNIITRELEADISNIHIMNKE